MHVARSLSLNLKRRVFYHSKAWNYVILETMQEFTLMQLNNISILRVT